MGRSTFTLYGDDLDAEQIARWFAEEAAYHNQFTAGRFDEHPKMYRVFDWHWLFRRFHPAPDDVVLDFGCAEGRALSAVRAMRPFRYVGVDASESLLQAARRLNPEGEFRPMPPTGIIPAQSGEFDHAVVLGVLHHVPNVGHYLGELARVLKPGGMLYLREPNHSMGRPVGSRRELPGVSPNERGIPAEYLTGRLADLGFRVTSVRSAYHGLILYLLRKLPPPDGDLFWSLVLGLDTALNRLTFWPPRYERLSWTAKLMPTATYLMAEKKSDP